MYTIVPAECVGGEVELMSLWSCGLCDYQNMYECVIFTKNMMDLMRISFNLIVLNMREYLNKQKTYKV